MAVSRILDRLREVAGSDRFDDHLVKGRVIDTGGQGERAREVAARLNEVRPGLPPKQALVLWTRDYSAITRRGRWVYVAIGLAQRLSDDALAFVLGHEMAHHDLRHMTTHMNMAAVMGYSQDLELQADRHGMVLAERAGYDPRGALEAFHPALWDDEESPLGWHQPPPGDLLGQVRLRARSWLDRMRRSHPTLATRREAIEAWLAGASARH